MFQAPLLGEEDGNNNGDINGNSDMTDNNAVLVVNEPAEGGEQQLQRRGREDLDLVEGRRREDLEGRRRAVPTSREAEPPPRYPGLERRDRADASSSDSDTE